MSGSDAETDAAGTARALVAVDRAMAEFRRGRLVGFQTAGDAFLAAPAEGLSSATLDGLRRLGAPRLVLTRQRAAVLRVRTAGTDPVLVPVPPDLTADDLAALADASQDLARPLRGPYTALRDAPPAGAAAAVALAKLAHLLPGAVGLAVGPRILGELQANEAVFALPAGWVEGHGDRAAASLRIVTQARVPLADAEDTRIVVFRPGDGGLEHLAIIVGDPRPGDTPATLVRLHSECFTGDLLGSLRCDCGEQLRGAIAAMRAAGSGILLYLAQEGRGIGLVNKLRAYRLQDQGFDTVEANERLGFGADERLFRPAAEMLRLLGHERVRLLTNNPDKVAGLQAFGIQVGERVGHAFPANVHNEAYLATKKRKSGHFL